MEERFRNEIEFRSDSQRGMYGVREGQLLHIGDAMNLFNEAWSMTRRSIIIKWWLKSLGLPENLRIEARELLESLLPSEPFLYLTDADSTQVSCKNVVSNDTSADIFNDMQIIVTSESSVCIAPVQEILQDAQDIVEISDFIATINSPASFDTDSSRNELSETFLQPMFDENSNPSILVEEVRSQQ